MATAFVYGEARESSALVVVRMWVCVCVTRGEWLANKGLGTELGGMLPQTSLEEERRGTQTTNKTAG